MLKQMYEDVWEALGTAAGQFEPSLPTFETTFAPVPPQANDLWLQILLDFVTLGATALAAPIFNSCKYSLPSSL
jgi:hypothetical protein